MPHLDARSWFVAPLAACLGLLAARPGAAQPLAHLEAHLTVSASTPGPVIDRHIFGQFAEHLGHGIYGGVWVGKDSPIPNTDGYRNDVMAALRELKVPVIRWPGGCFADGYDWRDGIGPAAQRPVRVNTNWGGVDDPNSFGTHEFMDFAERVGADAYVAGDIGSAPPRDLSQWVEYITSPSQSRLAQLRRANGRDQPWKLPFVGVGNEVWGCGGHMRAEYAADVYRRYQTFINVPPGQKVAKIASGPNGDDYAFTDTMMRLAGDDMDGLSLHYYTIPTGEWAHKGSATEFSEAEYIATLKRALKMDEIIARTSAIMDKYDPTKRVALVVDEWGVWTDVQPGTNPGFLYQQNSLRDALVAAATLNIFAHHADRVRMANIAQMVNVLQAMILTDGPRMVLTPTYHVFDMYKDFQDAQELPVTLNTPTYSYASVSIPAVQAMAARGKDGIVRLALVNLDPDAPVDLTVNLPGLTLTSARGQILTAPAVTTLNTFENPDLVRPQPFVGAHVTAGVIGMRLPEKSVIVLELN
jgi:alpha-N-arabinofuranosidase